MFLGFCERSIFVLISCFSNIVERTEERRAEPLALAFCLQVIDIILNVYYCISFTMQSLARGTYPRFLSAKLGGLKKNGFLSACFYHSSHKNFTISSVKYKVCFSSFGGFKMFLMMIYKSNVLTLWVFIVQEICFWTTTVV